MFTEDEILSLNEFQQSGSMHPFTCQNCRNELVATKEGWMCPTEKCDYIQNWAHNFMKDWSWKKFNLIQPK